MWLRMPVEYLVSMLDWRRRIMAEEQMGAATVAMIPHMQKDDRERWSRTAMRDAQGSQQQPGLRCVGRGRTPRRPSPDCRS